MQVNSKNLAVIKQTFKSLIKNKLKNTYKNIIQTLCVKLTHITKRKFPTINVNIRTRNRFLLTRPPEKLDQALHSNSKVIVHRKY